MIRLSFELQVSGKSRRYVNRTEESFYSRADRGGEEGSRCGEMELKCFIYSFRRILLFFIEINFPKFATSKFLETIPRRRKQSDGCRFSKNRLPKVFKFTILKSNRVTILKSFKAVQVSRFQLFDIVTIFSKDFRIKPQLSQ